MPRRKIETADSVPVNVIDIKTGKPAELPSVPAICRRIRQFRMQKRLEQKELASVLGISGNTVCNWENGRGRPDLNLIPPLCAVLGISLADLFGAEEETARYSADEQILIDRYRALTPAHQAAVDQMIQTLLADQEAAACPKIRKLIFFEKSLAAGPGDPLEFEDEGMPIYLYADRDTDQADCVFTVTGDSMEPRFHDRDLVLVSRIPNAPDLQYGEIGAFIVGNETYIKQYEKDGLHSLNRRYGVMRFSDQDSVYLIGRVSGVQDPSRIASQDDVERYERIYGRLDG